MGLFDRFRKKKEENKVTTEDNSAQNKHVTVTKELESKYKDYQEELYFIKQECEKYNLDYKSLLERYNLKEKSKEEYFETYSIHEETDISLKIDRILRYIRGAKKSLNEIKNNSVVSMIEQNSPETVQRVNEHFFVQDSVSRFEELLEKEEKKNGKRR